MSDSSRSIVVAVRDSSSGRSALHRALSLARPGKDSIHLVHARRLAELTRVAELLVPRWINADVEEPDGDAWLEVLAVEARNQGHLAQEVRLSGTPGTAVADYAREAGAHLIVVACPRETLARKLFLGSTALRILRTASCPVLVARNDPAQVYASALVAIDGTSISRRVMAAAGACFPEARFDLAHAYRVPGEHKVRMAGASEHSIAEARSAWRLELQRDLQALVAERPQAIMHVEHGFPETVILELCNRLKPDVLVIGKHSGSALDEHVIGSVTQFLLYTCDTDFLLVP
jgi:nucleotide-binding universal stress UspA family protein